MFARNPRRPFDLKNGLRKETKLLTTKHATIICNRLLHAMNLQLKHSRKLKTHRKGTTYTINILDRGAAIRKGESFLVKIGVFDGRHKVQINGRMSSANPDIPVFEVVRENREGCS